MSFFGKLARGLATGAAGYYGEVAKSEMETRRAEILAARERALAEVNHANRVEEIRLTGEENRRSHTSAAIDDTAKERALIPDKAQAQITADRAKIMAKAEADYRLLPAQTKATLSIEQFKAQRQMEIEGVRQAGEDRRNDADNRTFANTHPTGTFEAQDGTPVITYGPGADTRLTKIPGGRAVRRGSSSGDDDFGGGGYTGGIAPSRPVAPQSPSAPTADKLLPGMIARNGQGQRMKLSESGKWIPIP